MMSPSENTTPASSVDGIEVWIIEDNPTLRRALTALIDQEPSMRCALVADSCEPAIAAVEEGRRADVVLMDIGLPGISGIEGTRRIKSLSPATDVVILTIHEDSDRVFDAIRAGASGYLLKPSSVEAIIEAVKQVRRGEAAINPSIARKILSLFSSVSTPRPESAAYGLTDREREILQLLVDGLTIRQTAGRLDISFHTVDSHIRNIYGKLHVRSRASAVGKAVQERLV